MTTFWLTDYCALFSSYNIMPFYGDDKNFKYNSLTRLIILVTIASYLYYNDVNVLYGGLISIFLTVAIYYYTLNTPVRENFINPETQEFKNPINIPNFNYENIEKNIKKDEIVNVENQITLNNVKNNTDLLKGLYFLDGDKSKGIKSADEEDYIQKPFNRFGDVVQNGVTKNLTLLNKNN